MATAGVAAAANYPVGCWGPPDGQLSDEVRDLHLMLAPLESLPELVLVTPVKDLAEFPSVIDVTLELQLEPAAPHLAFVDELIRLLQHHVQQPGVRLHRAQRAALATLSEQPRPRPPGTRRHPA